MYIFANINTTKIQCFKFYGIFEREKFTDDILYIIKFEIQVWNIESFGQNDTKYSKFE